MAVEHPISIFAARSKCITLQPPKLEHQTRQIYVYDDDPVLRGVLCEVFTDEGLPSTGFGSMTALLRAAESTSPALILADAWVDSYSVLSPEDRAAFKLVAGVAPLILMTSRSWASTITAEELGCSVILTKPFELSDLLAAVWQSMNMRDMSPSGKV